MYKNYGDKNFFELGILVDAEHSDTEFPMLLCRPYGDEEDLFQFARVAVDIEDEWIDRKAVMEYCGMTEETFDPIQFAIACTDMYSWDNFGALDYGVSYNWQRVDKETIRKELRSYLIVCDDLDMEELFPVEDHSREEADRIVIPLDDGFAIEATRNEDNGYKEIFIDLCKDGVWHQSLAVIGEEYEYAGLKVQPVSGTYTVKVWEDPDNEDWTTEHRIRRYEK